MPTMSLGGSAVLEVPTRAGSRSGDDPSPRELRIDARSGRLARALRRLGVGGGDVIGVLCCERHAEDGATAHRAGQELAAITVTLHLGNDAGSLQEGDEGFAPRVVLACREGGQEWMGKPSRQGILISDVPGAYWWRLLEAREGVDDQEETGGNRVDC